MEKPGIQVFETGAREYDAWFDDHRPCYEAEIRALKTLAAPARRGLEVGAGTGRFAVPLGIGLGVEPARAMARMAQGRGLQVIQAVAEALPFAAHSFDLVAMVTVLCFLQDPLAALAEASRVLAPGGQLLIGMIDKDSPLGRRYEARQAESTFFRAARFYGVRQVLAWLRQLGFRQERLCQTLFQGLTEVTNSEPVREGWGEGGFVVIAARKVDRAGSGA